MVDSSKCCIRGVVGVVCWCEVGNSCLVSTMTSDERDLGAMRQSASRQMRIGLGCSYLDTDGESLPIHVIINKHGYSCIRYGAINFVE
jgi:hypothetical protein